MCATLPPPLPLPPTLLCTTLLSSSLYLWQCWATAASHVQCWNPFHRRCRFLSSSLSLLLSFFWPTSFRRTKAESKQKIDEIRKCCCLLALLLLLHSLLFFSSSSICCCRCWFCSIAKHILVTDLFFCSFFSPACCCCFFCVLFVFHFLKFRLLLFFLLPLSPFFIIIIL